MRLRNIIRSIFNVFLPDKVRFDKAIRLESNLYTTVYSEEIPGRYLIYLDFSQLYDGESVVVNVDILLNHYWRTFVYAEISNYQISPAVMMPVDYVDGLRVKLKQSLGVPKDIYVKVRRQ
jgi:hypothetical protein